MLLAVDMLGAVEAVAGLALGGEEAEQLDTVLLLAVAVWQAGGHGARWLQELAPFTSYRH